MGTRGKPECAQLFSSLREAPVIGISRAPGAPSRGLVRIDNRIFPCALGKAGVGTLKREGDGTTPRGVWPVRGVFARADRVSLPRTRLPVRALSPGDGWCDDPADRNYNRPVRLPYPASAEGLWRDDHLYDLVAVLGYNDRPRVRGLGSAIFMHLAAPGWQPTAGCIAMRERDLRMLLSVATRKTLVGISG